MFLYTSFYGRSYLLSTVIYFMIEVCRIDIHQLRFVGLEYKYWIEKIFDDYNRRLSYHIYSTNDHVKSDAQEV